MAIQVKDNLFVLKLRTNTNAFRVITVSSWSMYPGESIT